MLTAERLLADPSLLATDPVLLALVALWLPFAAFLLLAVIPPLRRTGRLAGWVSILAVAGSLMAATQIWGLIGRPIEVAWDWIPAFEAPLVTVGLYLDYTSAAMLVLVALVAFLVQLYSLGYMADESAPSLGRYYAYHSLFAFSMMGLVLSNNFLQMFIFWELVGLSSYLLIGFWYQKPEAARAAVKAFWVTKFGDLGFIIGIVLLWRETGTFTFTDLFLLVEEKALPVAGFGLIMLLIYLGAVGKSAQFPLHVWLPDAMEGPTPVSALIHAATMVAAGVYLVTRSYPLFEAAPDVLTIIAWVGAFTALLAATLALVQDDIKRVLAYSTVSQLGYMMAALGAGGREAGFFHLGMHGLFKALLFLGAGSVIHAVATNDIFKMGGLMRQMPQTGLTFLVGTLALAGIWPFAGFFSKEEVLNAVWTSGLTVPFGMLALTVFLTAFYMFRVIFLAFFGRVHGEGHAHEAPWSMLIPLWLLTLLTVGLGVLFAYPGSGAEVAHHGPDWLMPLSLGLAILGILFAWVVYQQEEIKAESLAKGLKPFYIAARRNYWLDDFYAGLYRGVLLAFSTLIGWIDRYLVDGLVNVASAWTIRFGQTLRLIQSGRAQDYLYGVALGLLALIAWGYLR